MKGIIFTDIDKLSEKFFGSNDADSKSKIENAISNYMKARLCQGVEYQLLDVSNGYSYMIAIDNSWKKYRAILNDYRDSLEGMQDNLITVFILGGHDVIPVPRIKNFEETSNSNDEYICSDFLYSLDCSGSLFDIKDSGYYTWDNMKRILSAKPIFNVSRLPLETGSIHMEELTNYFSKVEKCFPVGKDYINLEKLSYIACSKISNVAKRIIGRNKDLSIIRHHSPTLDIINPEHEKKLFDESKDSDIMVFMLHGSSWKDNCGYYGERKPINTKRQLTLNEMRKRKQKQKSLTAFLPANLNSLHNTKLIAGLCCFGARYVGYNKEESMLMTALSGNSVVSFMGSSNSVFGCMSRDGEVYHGEYFLQTYLRMINEGCCSAEAVMKARYYIANDYFNYNIDPNLIRTYLITIFEFNIFGDPFIKIKGQDETPSFEKFYNHYLKMYNNTIGNISYNTALYDLKIEMDEAKSELTRGIYKRVRSQFYERFGYERDFDEAYTYDAFGKKKYKFCILDEYEEYTNITKIYSDAEGNIEDVLFTYA